MGEVSESGSVEPEGMQAHEDRGRPDADAKKATPDSSTFARCLGCASAEEIDRSAGTLVCGKYSMRINAEVDEIPDDCVGFTAIDAESGED